MIDVIGLGLGIGPGIGLGVSGVQTIHLIHKACQMEFGSLGSPPTPRRSESGRDARIPQVNTMSFFGARLLGSGSSSHYAYDWLLRPEVLNYDYLLYDLLA
ncbi:hypothetical protein QCA50_016753 [Cerrena zonata]|uniref:Uncharacterized protein n=1 Tax=Cerrena zonata TaxID=2478898 RepID=A0AAW0FPU5_9APHY